MNLGLKTLAHSRRHRDFAAVPLHTSGFQRLLKSDLILMVMRNWTEQDVIEKLDEGWLLSGDIGADVPFSLINPSQTRADFIPSIEVMIVRALHGKGALVPVAVPGKKMMYRRNPRQRP